MKKFVIAAFAAVTALAPAAAFAQPHGEWHRHTEWRRGYHMHRTDWERGSRVDWRAHHLRAPRRGYEWREVDGNYVLAAAATGLIVSAIAASH